MTKKEIATIGLPAAAGKKSFTFGAHFASTGGQSSAEGFDFANSLLKLVADESGYTMKLEKILLAAGSDEGFRRQQD